MNKDTLLIFEQYVNKTTQLIEEKKKLAKKDYDGDGKVETSGEEWMGSRAKAIAAAKGKKNQEDNEEDVEVTKNKPQYKGARAGKDIGQKGKWFGKIAKSAGKKYGSKDAGKRVAGAILSKMRHEGAEVEELEVDETKQTKEEKPKDTKIATKPLMHPLLNALKKR